MTIQYSVAVRNARLDAIEATIAASAVLKIYSGSMPAAVADARTGTVLATLNLPSNWMDPAASGTVSKAGTWQDLSADNSGTAGYFTIFASDGTTAHIQGTVGLAATDMIVDSVSFTAGQTFTVTSFQITTGNA
jgi:hypothetical protein